MPATPLTASLRPLTGADAAQICRWHYPPPYHFYDLGEEVLPELLRWIAHYQAITRQSELIGFFATGKEVCQIPGGRYPEGPLDIGIGLRPDLTGRGLGEPLLRQILAGLREPRLRLTVAEFNARAITVYHRLGFRWAGRFVSSQQVPFWIMERYAGGYEPDVPDQPA